MSFSNKIFFPLGILGCVENAKQVLDGRGGYMRKCTYLLG